MNKKIAEYRIRKALKIAEMGTYDGAHHKQYVIDQMVRALTGCPLEQGRVLDCNNIPYTYKRMGKSEEYLAWVAAVTDGADGPDTYEWSEGIAP